MPSRRKILEYWTEVKRVVDGQVKQTCCCCKAPGATAKECMIAAGHKSRCACFCHSKKLSKNPQ